MVRKDQTLYFEPANNDLPREDTDDSVNPDDVMENDIKIEDESIKESDDTSEPKSLPRKPIPVDDVESIYCFSELRFNTKFLNFLAQKQITLHLFNYYGYYTGSFYPREPFISGKLLVKQVNHYEDALKRIQIARKFVSGSAENIRKNLMYYNSRDKDLSFFIDKADELIDLIDKTNDVPELMGIEGNIHSNYYTAWNLIIDQEIRFSKREKHPPTNPINALISFTVIHWSIRLY